LATFDRMKTYNRYILLPVLIAFSFFTGSSFLIPKGVNTAPSTSSAITYLSKRFDVSGAEIGHYYNNISNGIYSAQGLQKIHGHFSYHEKGIVIALTTILTNGFIDVELFDNTNLFHNYPSHNFW
jgi:hypothetical protein